MHRLIAIVVAVSATAGALVLAAPAGAQTPSGPTPAAVRQLIASIPEPQRNQCQISDPATEEGKIVAAEAASIRAMVRCYSVDNLKNLWYVLTDSADSTNRLYRSQAGTQDPATPYRDEDAQCPGETTWGFGDAKNDGMLACYYSGQTLDGTTHDESAVLVWTYTAGNIVALAESGYGDNDAAALKKWWNDDAGPLKHPGTVKGFVDWTVRDRRAEQTLLSHVPKAIRASCLIRDRSPSSAFSGARLWATAVVSCKSGKVGVAYASMNPAIVKNFVDEFSPADKGDPCPAASTWSIGKGKNKRTIGDYACFSRNEADGTNTAQIVWSQRELGIVSSAVLATGTEDLPTLFEWWKGDSGPV